MTDRDIASLRRYLPDGAIDMIVPLLESHPLKLKIAAKRHSKQGDYRRSFQGNPHRISVNGDLNPYAFLITLLHEYAHLLAFEDYGAQIKPHGSQWQRTFRAVSKPFLEAGVFPADIAEAFADHLRRGQASTASHLELKRAIDRYNLSADGAAEQEPITRVEQLSEGKCFILKRRLFKKGPRARTRYKCQDMMNKEFYMVHPLAEITPITSFDDNDIDHE